MFAEKLHRQLDCLVLRRYISPLRPKLSLWDQATEVFASNDIRWLLNNLFISNKVNCCSKCFLIDQILFIRRLKHCSIKKIN